MRLLSGLYSDFSTNPLVRKGILSWKSKTTDEFIIDGFLFGGNSGSPVFSKIDPMTGNSYLIGIVFSHLNEFDKTITQTDTISYNADLDRCVSSDQIINLINIYKKKCK